MSKFSRAAYILTQCKNVLCSFCYMLFIVVLRLCGLVEGVDRLVVVTLVVVTIFPVCFLSLTLLWLWSQFPHVTCCKKLLYVCMHIGPSLYIGR